jgi:hypothetical protein
VCLIINIAGDPEFAGFTGANNTFRKDYHKYRLKVLVIVHEEAAGHSYPDPAVFFYTQQEIGRFLFYASYVSQFEYSYFISIIVVLFNSITIMSCGGTL